MESLSLNKSLLKEFSLIVQPFSFELLQVQVTGRRDKQFVKEHPLLKVIPPLTYYLMLQKSIMELGFYIR